MFTISCMPKQSNCFRYFITFGQKSPFRNGWVEIEVRSIDEKEDRAEERAYNLARDQAFFSIGDGWSNIYDEGAFTKTRQDYFPAGKLGETIKL